MSAPALEAIRIAPAPRARASAAPISLERLAGFAARLLDVPVALVSLLDGGPPYASPEQGGGWRARRLAPLSRTLDQHAVRSGLPLVLEDARTHPLVREHPGLWMG